ncbi:sensor histidine kinase [Clostridium sp. LBM24168]
MENRLKCLLGLFQILLVIILSVIGINTAYNFYVNNNLKYLHRKNTMLQKEFYPIVGSLENKLVKYTNYYHSISENKINKKDFENHDFKTDENTPLVQFVLVDNRNKKTYWNYWTLQNIKIYDGDSYRVKNVEEYVRKNSAVYQKIPNSGFEIQKPGNYTENSVVVEDVTLYAWIDKRDNISMGFAEDVYNKVNTARTQFILIVSWLVILGEFLISKTVYIKNNGLKKVVEDIKCDIEIIKSGMRSLTNVFSIHGIYKKSKIILVLSIVVYLIDYYVSVNGGRDFIYFIKKILYFEYPLAAVFLIIICIIFYFSMKKLTYFKYILNYTSKIAQDNIEVQLILGNYYYLSKLAEYINLIKNSYDKALTEKIENEKLRIELITNVSHDLKTPLTSMVTYADLLKRDGLKENEREEYINIIDRKVDGLKAFVDSLLEVSMLFNGKVSLNREKVNIVELIYQVIGEWSGYYEEKNIKFEVKSFKEQITLNIDSKKISRLIGNLVSNALKYSLPNTKVYIELENRQDKVVISFKNISQYEMKFNSEEIFQRFKRGDVSRNSQIEGSGLGLAIAKSIAELHSGSMYIDREGDLFKIYLILPADESFQGEGQID